MNEREQEDLIEIHAEFTEWCRTHDSERDSLESACDEKLSASGEPVSEANLPLQMFFAWLVNERLRDLLEEGRIREVPNFDSEGRWNPLYVPGESGEEEG